MAVLGKRKARPAPGPEQPPADERRDIHDVFRKHFESRFEPLRIDTPPQATCSSGGGGGDDREGSDGASEHTESEWGGLSNDDDGAADEEQCATGRLPAVEVVDYSASQSPSSSSATMSKREFKDFMSSRPPNQASESQPTTLPDASAPSSSTLPEDAPSLLAQDLELRRLLAESHLLSPHPSAFLSSASSAAATPRPFNTGRTRHKATDLRIQALGSKVSILKQEKMPMNMRKGIVGAAATREAKRRREARESGVVLERETGKKRRRDRARDVAVDRPGVGRLKGAELRLSERDVKSIEGSRDTFGRRGARGR